MARSRNIKPGFFTNDKLAECDPLARIAFQGLWCHADREGRIEYRSKKLKAEILPYDDCDFDFLISQLAKRGFVLLYEVDEIKYLQVVNFLKHQNPHLKEQESTIPAPDKHHASTMQEPDKQQPSTELARLIPDSLNLIPDSLIASVKTDGNKSASLNAQAKELLDFLNEKAGRRYQPVDANMKFIVARLKEYSLEDLRSVVAMKCREWVNDENWSKYLSPDTLFNATKCAKYIGQLHVTEDQHAMP